MPALLAVSALEGISLLRNSPSILSALQDNIRAARAILDRVDCISIPSHPASPIIHIQIRSPAAAASVASTPTLSPPLLHPSAVSLSHTHSSHGHAHKSSPNSAKPADAVNWDWDVEAEERLLQEIVEETLHQGVMITKAKRLRGQEVLEARPSIRLALTSALTRKETEKAVTIVKGVLVKVLGRRK